MRKRERERERERERGREKRYLEDNNAFCHRIYVADKWYFRYPEGEGEVEGEKRSGLVKSIPEVLLKGRRGGGGGRRREREENVGHTSINNLLRSLYKEHSLFNALRYFFS